jgi:hypothetical protein
MAWAARHCSWPADKSRHFCSRAAAALIIFGTYARRINLLGFVVIVLGAGRSDGEWVMHVLVNGLRLFFDVEGAKLVPNGPAMREKPTLLLLHGGPGFDHSIYKPAYSGPLRVLHLKA